MILVITLLYWGREALRDYDRIRRTATSSAAVGALPAPRPGTPPRASTCRRPRSARSSSRSALTMLVAGMVVGGWALLFGLDRGRARRSSAGCGTARREYAAVEAADRTGHLDLGGAPAWPKATFAALGAHRRRRPAGLVGSSCPVRRPAGPGAGGGPAAAAARRPRGPGGHGGGPAAAPRQPAADVMRLTRGEHHLRPGVVTVPAGKPFTIAFDNRDTGVPHDIVIKDAAGDRAVQGRPRHGSRRSWSTMCRPFPPGSTPSSARSTRT